MSKQGLRRKVVALCVSAGLLAFNIPVLASPDDSSNGVTNVKKGTQKVESMIQVPPNKNSNQRAPKPFNKSKKYKQGEVIVKFKSGRDVKSLGRVATQHSIKLKKNLNKETTRLLTFNPKTPIDQVIKDLEATGQVEYAEPNYLRYAAAVTDPRYGELWGLKNTGQAVNYSLSGIPGIDIGAEKAWAKTQGSTSIVVGVIDTGIDINHPDLKDRIWKNTGETANDGIDNDNNGYVDDVNGWDFANNDKGVYDVSDGDEHGTHVAGTIGATANTIGVIGVAPKVKIMPLKFIGNAGGSVADEISAIEYAKAKGVKILNMSIGGYGFVQAEYDAIRDYNGLFVAAAGNEANNNDGYDPSYPAGYDLANILSVAAIDNFGNVPYWSNYGPISTDIAAPGVDILSTVPGYNGVYTYAYDYFDGTSMATPHVTGTAALLLSSNSSSSTSTIKNKILSTAKPLSSLQGIVSTGGMLDAGKAVNNSDNDIPGVPLTGTSKTATVNASTDVDDVYSFALAKGEKVKVTLTGDAGTDFDIYLYKPGAKTVKSSAGIVAYSEKTGTSSETFTYYAQEEGTYYLDVSAYKGSGSYKVTVTKGATAGTYENTSKAILYTGLWEQVSATSASGGNYKFTNEEGAKAEFIFNGTGVTLTGLKSPNSGYVKITVDGVSKEVSMNSSKVLFKQQIFTKTGLSAGRHVMTIEWTGKRASGSKKTQTKVNIDAITVVK